MVPRIRAVIGGEEAASVDQFGGPKEVVIAGGVQRDAVNSVGVDQHIVEIPEVNVGQVIGDDALDWRQPGS